jgi:phospholipase/lecithinase/hemolysin
MNRGLTFAVAAGAALLMAGCGGGGNPSAPSLSTVASVNAASTAPSAGPSGGFNNFVVFGDSLSDDGAYTLAAIGVYGTAVHFTGLPYSEGGQFTVNGASTGNWTGVLAQTLGLSLTPNVIGYTVGGVTAYLTPGGQTTSQSSATCAFNSAPAGSPKNCTDFAQGGSMVATADGIGHSTGALTFPVTQQLQNYLGEFGSFNSSQLISVLAGNNDIFSALSGVQTAIGSGVPQATAVAQAQAAVGVAADELAGVVKSILSNGGRYVMVYTLPDSSLSPFGQSLAGGTTCDNQNPQTSCYLLSNLVQVFNQRLLNDLQGQPVKMIDGYALLNQEIANPSSFGFTNVTTPWCDLSAASVNNTSLLCNVGTPATAYGASTSNLGTWLFADALHPTPAGYQVIANATLAQLRSFGWVS